MDAGGVKDEEKYAFFSQRVLETGRENTVFQLCGCFDRRIHGGQGPEMILQQKHQ